MSNNTNEQLDQGQEIAQKAENEPSAFNNSVFATIVSIKGDLAVLRTENGQEIVWPLTKLPSGASASDEINLIATSSVIQTTEKIDHEKAKKILEMILNSPQQ